jgi:DNA-binding CsgD family transcriptional regulator
VSKLARRNKAMHLTGKDSDRLDALIAFAIANGISTYKLAKMLGVQANTLTAHAGKMGLKFRSASFWTADELAELRRLAPSHTVRKIADILGRSTPQVRNQAAYRRIIIKAVK